MATDVLLLGDPATLDRSSVGGKAAGLARLVAAGFPVPRGFVIPARALESGDPGSAARAAVTAALARMELSESALAVRSSALDEDSADASFAGQYLTVLDVRGTEALWEAVRRCVESLGSAAAAAYRAERASARRRGMAVVIQEMVAPDVAGVAFTADPVSGRRDRIVVEAVRGLGEQLVSGQVEADRVAFQRETLEPVEEHHPGEDALPIALAREVAHAALRVEEAFGAPQDIEFAVAGGTIWLLQARPVTTAGRAADAPGEFDSPTSPADRWTSANVQEVLPGLLTPLAMSSFDRIARRAYNVGYQRLHVLNRDEWYDFMGVFYSRAFLNIGPTRIIADRVIGTSGDAVEHRFLGGELPGKARRRLSPRLTWYRLRSMPFLLRMMFGIHRIAARAATAVAEREREVRRLDLSALTNAELEALRLSLLDFGADIFATHLQATGCAGAGFDLVAQLVRPHLGDDAEGRLPALFTGLPGVESAQIGFDLWNLAKVAVDSDIQSAVRDSGFEPGNNELPARWRATWASFLERHGHRGMNEMEPSARSWRQDPAPALQMLRAYLDLDESHSPQATFQRQEQERLRLTREVEHAMNPVKRLVFRDALRRAQGWVALREFTKSVIVRASRITDFVLPEYQARLLAAGVIDDPGDLFFLHIDEVTAFISGRLDDDVRPRILRRRREMERHRHLRLPERFSGRPVPLPPEEHAHAGDMLTGTPVSPGVVTGRARVVLDPSDNPALQPGEILVAPVTDAGWTPLFAIAAGLVVDIGSALSHGSTVAREYGLPAVVNVKHGTSRIRTGDLVTVNGTAGTVAIVEAQ